MRLVAVKVIRRCVALTSPHVAAGYVSKGEIHTVHIHCPDNTPVWDVVLRAQRTPKVLAIQPADNHVLSLSDLCT